MVTIAKRQFTGEMYLWGAGDTLPYTVGYSSYQRIP
jgi:hypothetical protein